MVTEGERKMRFKNDHIGLLDHNKKFRFNSKCNGKPLKDLTQRSDML